MRSTVGELQYEFIDPIGYQVLGNTILKPSHIIICEYQLIDFDSSSILTDVKQNDVAERYRVPSFPDPLPPVLGIVASNGFVSNAIEQNPQMNTWYCSIVLMVRMMVLDANKKLSRTTNYLNAKTHIQRTELWLNHQWWKPVLCWKVSNE